MLGLAEGWSFVCEVWMGEYSLNLRGGSLFVRFHICVTCESLGLLIMGNCLEYG